jgi:hypothetical protein
MRLRLNMLTIFVHLTKCAGRAFSEVLLKQFQDRAASRGRYEKLSEGEKWQISLLYSEFNLLPLESFREKYSIVQEDLRFITVLRNPIEQLFSYIYYWIETGRWAGNVENLDWLSEHEWDNTQCRQLSGLDYRKSTHAERLESAKENLERMAAIGLVERFPESVEFMNWKFAWNLEIPRVIGATHRPLTTTMSEDLLRQAEDFNRFDLELYSYAEQFFERQLEKL